MHRRGLFPFGDGRATPGAASADTSRAVPQAIFDGRLEKGADDDCPDTGPLFAVGTFGSPSTESPATPIKDGESFAQGTASVTCSVTPAGSDDFDLSAAIALSGATGGLFQHRRQVQGDRRANRYPRDLLEPHEREHVRADRPRLHRALHDVVPGRRPGTRVGRDHLSQGRKRRRADLVRGDRAVPSRELHAGVIARALGGFSPALRQSSSAARCCPWGTPPRRRTTFALWTSAGIGTRTVVGPPRVGSKTLARL